MSTKIDNYSQSAGGPQETPANLIDLLRARAHTLHGRAAYTFLEDGESEETTLTYGELDRRARAVGAWLQAQGLGGRRVLLLFPQGLEYIAAFWGCLYAGAVAVPAYPPRLNRNLHRLQSIVSDAEVEVALTTAPILSRLESFLGGETAAGLRALRCVPAETIGDEMADEWREPSPDGDALAFLQYTSGSTNASKGVMVSHANLLHNEAMIQRAFRQTEQSVIVSWLPMYHDMGLIGSVLQPLYLGVRCVLMSPASFLQRPFRWLRAISRYGATTSGGPNFAYDMCVRKTSASERATLDLSRWDVAFNGSEPVRAETLERFAEAFGPCGFRRSAFHPCYGLAEATLLVSGGSRAALPVVKTVLPRELENDRVIEVAGTEADGAKARAVVGCGDARLGQRIIIADPQRLTVRPSDEVGEIWVGGPSVAGGYWRKPEETAQTFHAYLADTGEGPFLRTGDLGFLMDGELFITGRLKDLIIIRGRNLYPHDIERTAEQSHASLRPGGGAAFGIESEGEERLALVLEVERRSKSSDYDEMLACVRQAVAEEYEVQPHAVALVKAGSVPKTSSGKVQRRACRELFLSGSLELLSAWREATTTGGGASEPATTGDGSGPQTGVAPRGFEEITVWLCAQLASKVGVAASSIDAAQPVTRYGLDSLLAVELMHAAETGLGVSLPLTSFLQSPSVAELAAEAARQLAEGAPAQSAMRIVAHEGPLHPLSHGQQALWFLYRMAPESAAYNIAVAVRIHGPVDALALGAACDALVARHPSLRTTFETLDGEPVQRVHERAECCFELTDASRWSEASVREHLAAQRHRPFDLAKGPLLRVHLLRRSEKEHVLLLEAHHIVVDFWSLAVMVQELGELYEAGAKGGSAKLPPLEWSYADYARWQAEMLEGREGERLGAYWERQLGGSLPTLNLLGDRPRPPVQTYRGASHSFGLGAGLSRRLRALGESADATLYMVLLAIFQTLLHRYTGQDELTTGSPTTGRDRAAFAGVVGYFVNPVVLRADLSGDPEFVELLGRVRRTVLDALAHQDYPFALLVQKLQPERDLSRTPLFQVMFVLQQTRYLRDEGLASFALGEAGARMDLGGLKLESLALEQRVAQFDLTLAMAETDGGLSASLEYNTDLFDETTMRGMAEHFCVLAEGVAAGPGRRLSALPLLSEGERRRLLSEVNDTGRDYEGLDLQLHQHVERQSERTPQAVAVVFGDEQISYAELNARANQLARRLRAEGTGPESLVGVLMERSVEMVVALLGVLKAGGAYVPLDPTYPSERLAFMLEDSGASVLLTQERLLTALPGGTAARVICLDSERGALEREGAENLSGGAGAENLAYMIYTSGSTGRPKGAMNTHRGIVNRLLWMQDAYRLGPADRVLQKTPFSFDVSVWEFFWPLMVGARLLLAQPGGHKDAAYLGEIIDEQKITTLHFVPSMLQAFLEGAAGRGRRHDSLRQVFCSGEALSFELQEQFHALFDAELHNLYGPTEAAIDVTAWACRRDSERRVVPIGRPIANTRLYVLDAHGSPVPVGVAGELHIGGVAVGRGYLGRADATAEKFIPDPFVARAGARMYRTGDLVRYLADGEVEYLGRLDHQVKVRGLRIELGEVEAALREHEGVRGCVVAATRDETSGVVRLVAYLVGDAGVTFSADRLRRFLKDKLPEYMIPSAFVTLPALPLLPNGKVDRRALPAPEGSRPELAESFVAPRDQVEEALAEIWADVLKLKRVGVHDNFFDLGGHSLLAAQVITRVQAVFGVELPMRRVFESPTVAGLAEVVSAETKARGALAAPPIERAPSETGLRPSFAQQRLWFLDQLEPGKATYNVPAAVRLTGRLDPSALARSIGEIVNRHEVLRTTFARVDGQPVRVVAGASDAWSLPVVDLREAGTPAAREALALDLATEEMLRPFDLERGPLLRTSLLRLGADDHMLLLTMHHIVSDGWSLGVFARELGQLYETFSGARTSPPPELPIQYADFARWQREWLRGPALEEALGYWKRQLAGDLPVLELPTDRPRLPVPTSRGATEAVALPAGLSDALKSLSRRVGATLFMTTLAAFQTLLHRYTGQHNILVGTPVAGRTRLETEGLIGLFVNTLVMRGDLSGDPSFAELLRRVRETALAAHAFQEVPFELLVEELHPARSLSHSPVFQVMFVWQNNSSPEMRLPGLRARRVEIGSRTAKFDLTFFLGEGEHGMEGYVEYNSDRFDAASIKRLVGHYRTLLEGVAAAPERRISELPLLPEAERALLLKEWNDTGREYPRGQSLQQLFEEQSERTPEATALICGEERLSYGELNGRANQLAHHLRALGVGPERRVGIMMERSVEMVVSLLAALKAGGAYVPLDPSYPAERLAFMLEDARATVLLMQERLKERLPGRGAHEVVCVDAEWESLSREYRRERPASSAGPENLAYLIYTSGSTGRPKGVAIEHRSAATLLHWAREAFADDELEGVLASTSICFDLSVFELFVPLSWGGKVILAANALELPELPAAREVTLINTVPSAMTELLRMGGVPVGVKTVNLAGEPLKGALVQEIYNRTGVRRVLNLYGPSEDTTYSTWAMLGKDISRPPSIGRPVANTQIYLLDERRQPVPVGVTGELYIGGDGLARGYLDRPDLTAERFVPNPLGDAPGARLYRTGDLARYRGDGEIEFLGRSDHQVKVRGFRIELGEIEQATGQHPSVREAVVMVSEDEHGDKRLVGYVVARQGPGPTTPELRAFLKERLPGHMVPAHFVTLDALPLTPNGKVDRRALEALGQVESDEEAGTYAPPRTRVERELAEMWEGLLGRRRVGVNDDFFELGGHSLLATQVVSRVREQFRLELPLRSLFETPTVAGLAAHIEDDASGEDGAGVAFGMPDTSVGSPAFGSSAPPIQRAPRSGRLPLSFAQQRLWFLDQLAPGTSAYNLLGGMRFLGALDVEALERSLDEVVRRHEALRTTYSLLDGEPTQVVHPDIRVALPVLDLRGLPAGEREASLRGRAREEARRAFDLSSGPLLRVTLVRLDEQEHVALVVMHHIVSDGWSTSILIGEVVKLYEAFRDGKPSSLPELPIQYADYARWQRGWLRGEVLDSLLAYWKRTLAGNPPVLELPSDRPRPSQPTFRSAKLHRALPAELYEPLRALARREGVTLYMTLLAAFEAQLHRYTNQDDMVLGTAIAGRNRVELEGLIGVFINMLVLRCDLSGNPRFRDLLKQVREVTLGAYAHQDMPFDKLVDELQPQRALSQTPLFQVAFGLQNAPAPLLDLPGLKLSPMTFDDEVGRYDLTLWMFEGEGGLSASWTYSTDLFDATTIERMHGHFETILKSVVNSPDQRLRALDIYTDAEKEARAAREHELEESLARVRMSSRRRGVSGPSDGKD